MNKVLLVEDDITLRMGIEYSLKNEGYEVVNSGNIDCARKLFNSSINLILLDVTLPDGNGYEFCKEVRKESNVPIIFLTACDEEANVVLGLDLGGDDYLTKPIRVRELIARINAVLRRRGEVISIKAKEELKVKDIIIDPLKCEVKKDNQKIALTAGEYKLLLLMVKNKGNVLSRKMLLEKLWDIEGDFIEEKTLTVYIRRLREKLGDGEYIETVRGIGYRVINK